MVSSNILILGLENSVTYYSNFWKTQWDRSFSFLLSYFSWKMCLLMYVNGIVTTGNDVTRISPIKEHLCSHFQTKDLRCLKYFLGIKVAQSKESIIVSQRKYVLDILEEIGMTNSRPADSPMDQYKKLMENQSEPLSYPKWYIRLDGKLIYLTITRSNLSFAAGVVSQFMKNPCIGHWNIIICISRYLKIYHLHSNADWAASPMDNRSTTGYWVFIGGNINSLKSKKQNCGCLESSVKVEYRAMVSLLANLWVKQYFKN